MFSPLELSSDKKYYYCTQEYFKSFILKGFLPVEMLIDNSGFHGRYARMFVASGGYYGLGECGCLRYPTPDPYLTLEMGSHHLTIELSEEGRKLDV